MTFDVKLIKILDYQTFLDLGTLDKKHYESAYWAISIGVNLICSFMRRFSWVIMD